MITTMKAANTMAVTVATKAWKEENLTHLTARRSVVNQVLVMNQQTESHVYYNRWRLCFQCKFIDPNNLGEPPKDPCGSAKYKGDGNCDDDNNKGCEYDGGDCCYKSVAGGKVKKKYCSEVSCELVICEIFTRNVTLLWCLQCKCIDPNNLGEPPKDPCGSAKYKGPTVNL